MKTSIAPVRYSRIINYIKNLEENVIITNKNDQILVEKIKNIINEQIKKLKIYNYLNLFFYIAIYISFISYISSDIIIISDIVKLLSKVISIIGTTFFFISLYFSKQIIDLYYQDLELLTAHVISIYSKYCNREIDKLNRTEDNYYKAFIEFFKERNFDEEIEPSTKKIKRKKQKNK